MAWLSAYNPSEPDGKVLLHYALVDWQGKTEAEPCTLHGEVRHGRIYALEAAPRIDPGARAS